MPLLTLRDAHLAFGPHVLLNNEKLIIKKGQRIGILGRNGAGKSTLLKVVAGEMPLDSGERQEKPNIGIATLSQSLPDADEKTVFEVVASGVSETGALLTQFQYLIDNYSDENADRLAKIQQQIDANDGWLLQQKIEQIITQLDLPADTLMKSLSGGWRRRVALGRALVSDPDILLLDEPTNHLDIATIEWLEQQVNQFKGSVLLITHDRRFLQKTANCILEVDRGHLRQWDGDYLGFLDYREQQLAAEETANALFDKKLAQEEVWIRQGIKARRTRNEGRVRALESMRNEMSERRSQVGKADFSIEAADRSGKIVIEAQNIHQKYGEKELINGFSTRILRGDRIGLIGANGSGKSTLLKILLGELTPDKGSVTLGTKLEIAYFDQLRNKLSLDKTVIDNISEGRDFIEINGKNRHIISYLQDFLFQPERARQPVSALSGGEQNRLILAKLFSKPANFLILDEPTNDLDLETLELLEELLLDFKGTLLLVSHDRAFVDNVVTSCIVFEGNGELNQYIGGYQDSWLAPSSTENKTSSIKTNPEVGTKNTTQKKQNKLSYDEKKQLDTLPKTIEKLEHQQEALSQEINHPTFYDNSQELVTKKLNELTTQQEKIDALYTQWETLENAKN